MLYDNQKGKLLYIFNYACWTVRLAIMTIKLFLLWIEALFCLFKFFS